MNTIISTASLVLAAVVVCVLLKQYAELRLFRASLPNRMKAVDLALDVAMDDHAPEDVKEVAVKLYMVAKSVELADEVLSGAHAKNADGGDTTLASFVENPWREKLESAVHFLAVGMILSDKSIPLYVRATAALFSRVDRTLKGNQERALEAHTIGIVVAQRRSVAREVDSCFA